MKKGSKIFIELFLTMALVIMMLTGCSTGGMTESSATTNDDNNSASSEQSSNSGEGKTVGLSIAMLSGNPFWQVLSDRLGVKLKELGYNYVVLDAQGDVGKQMSDVEDLISQDVDMVLINPYDSKAIVPVTLKAKEAGVPVIAMDIPIDKSGYCETTCICDNHEIGYNLGWYTGGLFKDEKVRVILISGYPGGIDSYDRRMGFVEGITAYQLEKFNKTGLDIVYHGWGDYAFDPATKTMEDALVRIGNEFDVLYCENDAMAMGALKAMEEAKMSEKKIIIGVDGWKQMYEYIKAGKTTATGLNSPVELADVTCKTVNDFLNGIEISDWVYTTPDVVDASNVDKYYDPNSIF